MTKAQLKLEYLNKYIHDIVEDSRHRMRMTFFKTNPERKVLRGCIDIDFYLLKV